MVKWEEDLFLLTPNEFDQLPNGIELKCIDGKTYTKGKDYIDQDTRYGHLAFGIEDPWNHELKHLFLVFKLKQ